MAYFFGVYEIAEMAARVEKASALFYNKVAAWSWDPDSREVFMILAGQEEEHQRAFEKIALAYKDRKESEEYSIDVRTMLEGLLVPLERISFTDIVTVAPKDMREALDVALRREEVTVQVYSLMRAHLLEKFRGILDAIIVVEQKHTEMVQGLRRHYLS
ncbi:MAG: hypothetical protein GX606_03930 [Elusimicrobia bacterium]|nr:hypothetical protein [Elusimicrobiota bacterium]